MNIRTIKTALLVVGVVCWAGPSASEPICASPEQVERIQDFYNDNPGTTPLVAAGRLKLAEAVIGSSLPGDQAASTRGENFKQVWAAMTTWEKPTVIIPKGADVFEVFSPISSGTTSKENPFFNLSHDHAFGGHLRPDLYSAIYVYSLPRKEDVVVRGVFFYDESGASIFGVMMSGKGPQPAETEITKFEDLIALIRSLPPVCPS